MARSANKKQKIDPSDENTIGNENMDDNPAQKYLRALINHQNQENLSIFIEQFIATFEKYNRYCSAMQNDSSKYFENALEITRQLDYHVRARLNKLKSGPLHLVENIFKNLKRKANSFINQFSDVNQNSHSPQTLGNRSSSLQLYGSQSEAVTGRSTSNMMPSTSQNYDGYETYDGNNPTIYIMIKRANNNLTSFIQGFGPLFKAFEKLNKNVRSTFGFSMYSEDFKKLCEVLNNYFEIILEDPEHCVEFQTIVKSTIDSTYKENLQKLTQNSDQVMKLKTLNSFLTDEFFKRIAIVFIVDIFENFPSNYQSVLEDMYLEMILGVCSLMGKISINDIYPEIHSTDIKKGINELKTMSSRLQWANVGSSAR